MNYQEELTELTAINTFCLMLRIIEKPNDRTISAIRQQYDYLRLVLKSDKAVYLLDNNYEMWLQEKGIKK